MATTLLHSNKTITGNNHNDHCEHFAHSECANKVDYSSVSVLLAIDNQMVREDVHDAFNHIGFSNCVGIFNLETFQKAIEESCFDLIIMSTEISGYFVAPVIAEMRNGRTRHHPFPIVLMLLPEGQKHQILHAINCGPDNMLLMPMALGPLLQRTETLAVQRKPFAVTVDYIGPDRGTGPLPERKQAPLVDVPNPLNASIRKIPLGTLQSEIDLTKIQLNAVKLERYGAQLQWFCDHIPQILQRNEIDAAKLAGFSRRMKLIAEDLPFRVRGDQDDRMKDLLGKMVADADTILRAEPAVDRRQFDRILVDCHDLAEEIGKILDPVCMGPSPPAP